MAFPVDDIGMIVEAAFGADPSGDPTGWTWTDLSDRLEDGTIDITRGSAAGAAVAATATARIPLTNDDHALTAKNPLSAWHPNVRRNLPVRVHRGTPHKGAGGGSVSPSTSHIAPSVTATKAGVLLTAWLAAGTGNYTLPGGMTAGATERDGATSTMRTARLAVSAGATGTKTATFSASQEYASCSVVAHGSSVTVQESLSAVVPNGGGTTTITTGSAQVGWWLVAVHAQDYVLGSLPDAPNDDFGGWIPLADSGLLVVDPDLYVLRMRAWVRRVSSAGVQTIRFGLDERNVGSDNHAAVFVLSGVDGWSFRFPGFAGAYRPSILPLTDGTQRIVTTVEAAGLLRRLERGPSPLLSAPVRYIPTDANTVAFWPLEDGTLSPAGLPLIGSDPLAPWTGLHPSGAVVGYPRFGSGDLAPWLPSVVSRSGDAALTILAASVSMPGFDPLIGWSVDFMYRSGTDAGGSALDINPGYLEGGTGWPQLALDPANGLVLGTFNSEPETSASVPAVFDGQAHHIRLSAQEAAGAISWQIYVDGVEVVSDTTGAASLAAITTIGLTADAQSTQMAQGYVSVRTGTGTNQLADAVDAAFGYRSEPAGRRIERLCREEGIRLHGIGDLDDTELMGPQGLLTFVDLLREAEAVDGGILGEARTDFALTYLTRAARYNRPVGITVDLATYRTTAGTSEQVLAPVYDDSSIVNDLTVSRTNGSAYRYIDIDSIAADGRYDEQVELNVDSDDQLPSQAGWRVNLGTIDENRYPGLPLDLAANPDLIDAWESCDAGTRAQRTNVPGAPDGIDQVIDGYAETLGPRAWTADANTSPAAPYDVGVWDEATAGTSSRWDSSTSTTTGSITSGASASVTVATTGTPWTTNGAHVPFDINLAGARVRVTAVSGASSPQTFTISTTVVNGVNKAVPSGTQVRLWKPGRWAL